MTQNTAKKLRKIQKELCDEFIMDTEKINTIMNTYKRSLQGFHNYSIGNLLLANYQLYARTGEGIELLASYKKWQEKGRQVRKGEKAIHVIAPRTKIIKETDSDGEEVEKTIVYFVRVPVFDLSQTDGDDFETDYTINNSNITYKEIKDKIIDIKINDSNKCLTRGSTDGKQIWISKHISDNRKICTLFHELAHYYLHFDENREELTSATKELEAEAVGFMIASYLGITNGEAGAYITNWAGNNSHELIKGKGDKLIKTALMIIEKYHLDEFTQIDLADKGDDTIGVIA